jgi:glycosyltransferase involved in cell wall biosynthesis
LPPEEHEARLKTAYAVIIPSLSEVSPNTAIDAIRLGKPVIVTEDTGLRELLQDVPLYVDTRSEAALVTAIENLLDPQFYATKQYECAHVALPYSWDVWVDTVERILRD